MIHAANESKPSFILWGDVCMRNQGWDYQTSWTIVLHIEGCISPVLLEEILAQAHENSVSYVYIQKELANDNSKYCAEIKRICEKFQNLGIQTDFAVSSPWLESVLQQVMELRVSLGQALPEPFVPHMFNTESSEWSYYKDWSVTLHDIEVITPVLLEEILAQAHEHGVSSVVIDTGFGVVGDDYVLADDYTYRDENWIVQEKYKRLGVHVNFTF